MKNIALFTLAAVLEIGGCFAFWTWRRQGASAGAAALGVLSLIGFALVLTRADVAFAGRAYAAYGGIYICASLVWLWLVEGHAPTAADVVGATVAVIGAAVIVGFAANGSSGR